MLQYARTLFKSCLRIFWIWRRVAQLFSTKFKMLTLDYPITYSNTSIAQTMITLYIYTVAIWKPIGMDIEIEKKWF